MPNMILIRGGAIENIIVSDKPFAETLGYDEVIDLATVTEPYGIGWRYEDGHFIDPTPPQPESAVTTEPPQ